MKERKFNLSLFDVYNSLVDRTGSSALMPEDVAREIVQGVPQFSSIMQLATRAPNMSRRQRRVPVLSTLPTAYFVNGDTGLKQTSQMAWSNKYFDAEELAVIIPIPEAVLDDSDYDIWGEIKPRIMEALGIAFDAAVMFGTNAPAVWPDDLLTASTAAGNTVALGTGADIYDDILGENGMCALVEADGFMVNGHAAHTSMRGKYRGLRDAAGNPIFKSTVQTATQYDLDGAPLFFPLNGAMNPASALQFCGDWKQLVYAIRQDVTYKILSEAVIQDGSGAIVYNLAQQDMVALRAVMRLAWQVPNPINRINATGTRFPFSALTP